MPYRPQGSCSGQVKQLSAFTTLRVACRSFEHELAAAQAQAGPGGDAAALVKSLATWQSGFIQRQETWLAALQQTLGQVSQRCVSTCGIPGSPRGTKRPHGSDAGANLSTAGTAPPALLLPHQPGGGMLRQPHASAAHSFPPFSGGIGKQLDLWKSIALGQSAPGEAGDPATGVYDSQGLTLSQLADVSAVASQEGLNNDTLSFLKHLDNSQSQPWSLSQLALPGQSQENMPPGRGAGVGGGLRTGTGDGTAAADVSGPQSQANTVAAQ
jgi:hypothetical protein